MKNMQNNIKLKVPFCNSIVVKKKINKKLTLTTSVEHKFYQLEINRKNIIQINQFYNMSGKISHYFIHVCNHIYKLHSFVKMKQT